MRKFTAEEVLDLLENNLENLENQSWRTNEWAPAEYTALEYGWTELGRQRFILDGEVYEVEPVDSTGGPEKGSNASVVFKFGEQYFRKFGHYASHYGYDWDGDFEEVEPYEKVVVDYRPV